MPKEIEKVALAGSVMIGVLGATLLGAWAQPRNRGEKQLTFPPGLNAFPNWGEVRRWR